MPKLDTLVPAFRWLKHYDKRNLGPDISAGLIVTILLVPQGMAYALLAGLPPIYGLYASILPAIIYAIFGTSQHMPVGPPALMALLTFTGVSAFAEPGSLEFVSFALLLALMAGVVQLILGVFRMGFLTNFISHPVLSGFIYASVVIIAFSQIEHLFGIPLSSSEHSAISVPLELGSRLRETNMTTLAISLCSIAALLVFSKTLPRLPAPLFVVIASTIFVYILGLESAGVQVVGDVPRGLPSFSLPTLDIEAMRALLPAALTVAFVGYIESISVAKTIAAKEKYKINSNQDLRALGLANIAAAFSSGFPVAGSFSRTAVQYQSGAKTQLASVVTAFAILATILFLTPLFYFLPNATLAAIIIVAVFRLVDFKSVRRILRVGRPDSYAFFLTFALTLLIGVEEGILVGALFSLLAYIRRAAYPHIAEMGYVREKDAFLALERFPEAESYSEILILRFDASLYYANVPFLEEQLLKATAENRNLRWIVIDCRGVNSIDVTAIEGLEDLIVGYRSRNIEILLTHVKLPIRERLEKAEWNKVSGGSTLYTTTRDALREITSQ